MKNDKINELLRQNNDLWVEKYRPKNVEDLALDENFKKFLLSCIAENSIPHLLLYGSPGTGKNSIVNVLLNNLNCFKLVINASEERGIDTIREKVQTFAKTASFGNKIKIIILNEADGLNYLAQDSLRELMETSSKYCRFIFTCNYIGRISDAIRSRCKEFELSPNLKEVANRIIEILESENVNYTDNFIISLIKKYGTDIRKMINECQSLNNIYDELNEDIISSDNKYVEYFDKIFNNSKSLKDISAVIKSMIFSEDVYTALNDYIINKYNKIELVIIIADHAYKSKFVADKDLILMSCILTLKDIL